MQLVPASKKAAVCLALAVAASLGVANSSRASVVTFAQFEEAIPGGQNPNLFSYTENDPTSGAATLGAVSVPVTFTYEGIAGLPGDLQGSQAATLTFSIETTYLTQSQYGGAGAGEAMATDPFTTSTLTITRDAAAAEGNGSKTDLLTVSFDAGELAGILGDYNPAFESLSTVDDTFVSYASDFLNFSNTSNGDFSVSFTSWQGSNGDGLTVDGSTGFFDSATAAGSGTFDVSNAPVTVPEPASLSLVALGALPLLSRRRRNRCR
ncbi:MAG TPA: PEP-CTERM sorting domain-containing protein [Tepidisphaeraceae bacterium]|nr:PEP-CTERM sorting domain-containing protein [Tepidisphaeraceae bacterium]